MTIGKRLRTLRRQRGLTLKQLSEICNVTFPYLSKIERDMVTVSYSVIEKIANGYGISMQTLMTGVNTGGLDSENRYPKSFNLFLRRFGEEHEITEDWKETLLSINFQGTKPETDMEWLELFLFLRRLLSKNNMTILQKEELRKRSIEKLDLEMQRVKALELFENRKNKIEKTGINWYNDAEAVELCDKCNDLYYRLLRFK